MTGSWVKYLSYGNRDISGDDFGAVRGSWRMLEEWNRSDIIPM